MLTFISNTFSFEVPTSTVWIAVVISLLIPVALHVLRAIGLYKLAKKKELKCAFMAWLPCVWIYVAIRLIGESRIFGKTMAKFAVLFTILFAAAELLTLAYNFIIYFPYVGNYLAGRNIYIIEEGTTVPVECLEYWSGLGVYGKVGEFVGPYKNIYLIQKIMNVIYYVSAILDIAYAVIVVTVFINLFRKYWPQHYVLASILSLFGLDGIFIFVIRNKQPVSYMDYLRSRYQNYNPYGPYGPNPYGQNPYGQNPYQNNPYGQNPNANAEPESPFEDFKDPSEKKPEDPFSDFSDKNR
ncbi:MAG: hypothetical protein IKB30_06595 [Clostridia bacterium]|nr:hypothetical protein [Clostridia bacterium]